VTQPPPKQVSDVEKLVVAIESIPTPQFELMLKKSIEKARKASTSNLLINGE
jgi:hypothetical protein